MPGFKMAALDGSKTNFGIAILDIDIDSLEINVVDLILIKTQKDKSKQVRKSSDNYRRSLEITSAIRDTLRDHQVNGFFMEVPSGGQSYDAVLGFGIVIGVYASIEGMLGIPGIEVSPSETKKAAVGTATASKREMIDWAMGKYPAAPWRMFRGRATDDNEHLADAVAICHAGVKTAAFKQTLAILKAGLARAA